VHSTAVELPSQPHPSLVRRLAEGPAASLVDQLPNLFLRFGLVAILMFFGLFKFTAVEAAGIHPLVAHSPFMSWLYAVLSERGVSNLIGTTEVATAVLLLFWRVHPELAVLGGIAGMAIFTLTLSFLVTTPGVWVSVPGFPVPVPGETGGFLIKDLFLLGAAAWCTRESLRTVRNFDRLSPPSG
jgi:uncharacterized membrane protein YkgB